jgi:hypothetical protein
MTRISNAGHDENGRYSGGKAGDQTGTEWYMRDWYSRPWNGVARHPNARVRAFIATYATHAANNNHIGYDQSQRTTFWDVLKHVKNCDPINIKQDCEADCSAGVAAICKAVGYYVGDKKLQAIDVNMYTGDEEVVLRKAGFDILTDSKYTGQDDYLVTGDILINTSHHTAINCSNGSKIHTSSNQTTSKTSSSSSNKYTVVGELKVLQKIIGTNADGVWGPKTLAKWGNRVLKYGDQSNIVLVCKRALLARGYTGVVDNNSFGNGTKNAVKAFQKKSSLTIDGEIGPKTATKLF